jgi:hypothetical protein
LGDPQEARQEPVASTWEKMSKSELAALAEREIAETACAGNLEA